MIDPERLLARFLRYVKVDTTATDAANGYPSSPGQLLLGRMLVGELRTAGLADADQSAKGIVMATLPARGAPDAPCMALNAHLDTSPETTGTNVRPIVWRKYDGRDLVLPGDPTRVVRVDENATLARLRGNTIITTDGTTLLGADDKAGVAVIMEAVASLAARSDVVHGPIRVLFTCDEEIGHGVDHVDLARLGAQVAYTLDGEGVDQIDVETFSADLATVTIRGVNIHPSIAKGRMVNAVRAAGVYLARLPRDADSPESTDGRDGFLHPYHVEGGVAQVSLRILLRDFETPRLAERAAALRHLARSVESEFPGLAIDVAVSTQYRNMAQGLAREPRAVAYAQQAFRNLGRQPELTVIRGGTDGSRLTELGLPTPNLSTGEHNPHSPLEWTCLEEMVQAAEMLVELARVWAESPASGS
jgi:tripeptide aminopeptidase